MKKICIFLIFLFIFSCSHEKLNNTEIDKKDKIIKINWTWNINESKNNIKTPSNINIPEDDGPNI